MEFLDQAYDVVVIGAGHAGVEAALAAARLGVQVALFTISLDAVANMPCNPSIGGTAKGHLVREIDALGGEMGKVTDRVFLQSRMLNRGKGPAVHSLRAQVDRQAYHRAMKQVVESQPGLFLRQMEIAEIRCDEHGSIKEVVSTLGARFPCGAVIVATGTFLNGRIFVGEHHFASGPDGMHAALPLSESLQKLGVALRRFKTGTPARVHKDSIDFSALEPQAGDEPVVPFSFETTEQLHNTALCHIAYTNEATHAVILENLHRSPLYAGEIEGIGPRYCPSIEDKVVRFADKQRHQTFVEPMGTETKEMYLQGLSSSLPVDVQLKLYRTIKGFEKVQIMRHAYAIEYDCADPTQLKPTLEFQAIPGLFGAGQFNGTSGYEEAAAQGLVAGINAAHRVLGKSEFVLPRASSYIGTLIDDIVTKGCSDPYRMMTSRCEFRLLLRQDNADSRLTPLGRELGLIGDARWEMFHVKQDQIAREQKRAEQTALPPSAELNALLQSLGTGLVTQPVKLIDLLRRPQLNYALLAPFDPARPVLPHAVTEQVEIMAKYEGYIDKQRERIEQLQKLEGAAIPPGVDYSAISGIRLEAREKLGRVQPVSLGQASRISGVSPADITVLALYLAGRGK
jgi:glucose-inhibited division protein A